MGKYDGFVPSPSPARLGGVLDSLSGPPGGLGRLNSAMSKPAFTSTLPRVQQGVIDHPAFGSVMERLPMLGNAALDGDPAAIATVSKILQENPDGVTDAVKDLWGMPQPQQIPGSPWAPADLHANAAATASPRGIGYTPDVRGPGHAVGVDPAPGVGLIPAGPPMPGRTRGLGTNAGTMVDTPQAALPAPPPRLGLPGPDRPVGMDDYADVADDATHVDRATGWDTPDGMDDPVPAPGEFDMPGRYVDPSGLDSARMADEGVIDPQSIEDQFIAIQESLWAPADARRAANEARRSAPVNYFGAQGNKGIRELLTDNWIPAVGAAAAAAMLPFAGGRETPQVAGTPSQTAGKNPTLTTADLAGSLPGEAPSSSVARSAPSRPPVEEDADAVVAEWRRAQAEMDDAASTQPDAPLVEAQESTADLAGDKANYTGAASLHNSHPQYLWREANRMAQESGGMMSQKDAYSLLTGGGDFQEDRASGRRYDPSEIDRSEFSSMDSMRRAKDLAARKQMVKEYGIARGMGMDRAQYNAYSQMTPEQRSQVAMLAATPRAITQRMGRGGWEFSSTPVHGPIDDRSTQLAIAQANNSSRERISEGALEQARIEGKERMFQLERAARAQEQEILIRIEQARLQAQGLTNEQARAEAELKIKSRMAENDAVRAGAEATRAAQPSDAQAALGYKKEADAKAVVDNARAEASAARTAAEGALMPWADNPEKAVRKAISKYPPEVQRTILQEFNFI